MMKTTQTLTSLAMLKVDLDQQHRNYVDYLVPFIVDVLNDEPPEIISDATVSDKLLGRFGLRVPTKAVQHVLRRLQKKGYIVYEGGIFDVTSALPKSDISSTRTQAQNHIDSVISAIIDEARAHNLSWTQDEAIKAVTGFLGEFTVDCLRTYVFNTALPKIPERKSAELYVVGKFVTGAQARNDPAFESFIILVKGLMYSNALLCPDLESLEKKFQDLTFYLDTPLVLNLLGMQGLEAKRSANELVALLKKLRGNVAVFAHTVIESQQVVNAAAVNLNNPRATGKVVEEARHSGMQLSDLILIRDTLDERLGGMGVPTKRTPDYEGDYQIDEREFESALGDEVYYKGENALLNDINSVRSIYVLRKGRQPARLEDAGAVFVTTNQGFAKAAFHAGRNHNSTREVSSVITAYSLANIAWLKSPLEAPTLPLLETMAICYAALEPSQELFKKYVQEMDKLLESGTITPRDHEILRLSPSARGELMELTLGDEKALTASSIRSILSNLKATILAESEAVHQAQIKVLADRGAIELSEAKERELSLMQRIRDVEAASTAALSAVESLTADANKMREMQKQRVTRIAKILTFILVLITVIALLLGALNGSGFISADENASPIWKKVLSLLAVGAVFWGVYSWHTGKTVRQIGKDIELRLARYIGSILGIDG